MRYCVPQWPCRGEAREVSDGSRLFRARAVELTLELLDTMTKLRVVPLERIGRLRPARFASAPRSRCSRHAVINDEYKPSLRNNAPLPALSRVSYSARTRALYFAEYRRGPRARSGTSGSGSFVSLIAPASARTGDRDRD